MSIFLETVPKKHRMPILIGHEMSIFLETVPKKPKIPKLLGHEMSIFLETVAVAFGIALNLCFFLIFWDCLEKYARFVA